MVNNNNPNPMKPIQSLIRVLSVLSAALLMQACTQEDLSVCETRLTINFQYSDGTTTTDAFPEEIEPITLFLFDANQRFVGESQSRHIGGNRHSLATDLPDGRYDLIAWQGVRNNYTLTPLIVGVTTLPQALLHIKQDAQGELERHNEPLYYGAAFGFDKVTTRPTGQRQTIEMVRKTYFIRLTIDGLPYSTPATRATAPEEEFVSRITSPDGKTNYDNALAGNKQLIHIPHHEVAKSRMVSDFVILYYPDLWESRLVLNYQPAGTDGNKQQLVNEKLLDLLSQNPDVDITVDTEFDIDITLDDLSTGAVTIRINGWKVTNGGGGIIG